MYFSLLLGQVLLSGLAIRFARQSKRDRTSRRKKIRRGLLVLAAAFSVGIAARAVPMLILFRRVGMEQNEVARKQTLERSLVQLSEQFSSASAVLSGVIFLVAVGYLGVAFFSRSPEGGRGISTARRGR